MSVSKVFFSSICWFLRGDDGKNRIFITQQHIVVPITLLKSVKGPLSGRREFDIFSVVPIFNNEGLDLYGWLQPLYAQLILLSLT